MMQRGIATQGRLTLDLTRRRQGRAALLLLLVCVPSLAPAVEPAPSALPPATPTTAAIPVAQIADSAERTDSTLRFMRPLLAPDAAIVRIGEQVPPQAAQIAELKRDSAAQLAGGLTPQALDDLRRQWLLIKDELTRWTTAIGTRTDAIAADSTQLTQLDNTWAATEVAAKENDLPDALRAPIRSARASIHDMQAQLRARRDTLLALLGAISSMQTQVSEALVQLDLAEQQMRRDLLTRDAPPLWEALPEMAQAEPIAAALRTGLARNRRLTQAFFHQQSQLLLLQALLTVVILAVTLTLLRRRPTAGAVDDMPRPVRAVLARPISAAAILALLLSTAVYRYAPIVLASLIGVISIVPLLRLFRGPAAPVMRRALGLLAALLLASTARRLLPPLAPVTRLILLAQSVGSVLAIVVVLYRDRLATLEVSDAWRRVAAIAMWSMLAALALSIVANLAGTVTLAMLLMDGVLGAATAAAAFLAASRVLEALLIQSVGSAGAHRVRSIAGHARPLLRRVARLIHLLMALLWVLIIFRVFGLSATFWRVIAATLEARLTMGTVSLSLADILTVLLTLWLSFFIARMVRVILEEDVLPRLSLPRGVPGAISVGVNYIILLIGLVFALSAAGVDPGRVTLVAGALSVGIGFGLQNVVNNFVSGIILLFERPIQIGDIVSFGDTRGQVRRIGFRSSTIATFEGAEVVVPNGTLLSEQVVNWTLSNNQRRIEITVGVAYGNDPSAVIGVLEGATKSVPDLLQQPAPRALFTGFGDSSLDFALWAWTDRQEVFAAVRSRVAIAVHDALRDAGIEIPFPQRDLHVKSAAAGAPPLPPTDENKR
jgi:potassium efflux system protein